MQQIREQTNLMVFRVGAALVRDSTRSAMQVELWGQCPPIVKMDASLGTLKACK